MRADGAGDLDMKGRGVRADDYLRRHKNVERAALDRSLAPTLEPGLGGVALIDAVVDMLLVGVSPVADAPRLVLALPRVHNAAIATDHRHRRRAERARNLAESRWRGVRLGRQFQQIVRRRSRRHDEGNCHARCTRAHQEFRCHGVGRRPDHGKLGVRDDDLQAVARLHRVGGEAHRDCEVEWLFARDGRGFRPGQSLRAVGDAAGNQRDRAVGMNVFQPHHPVRLRRIGRDLQMGCRAADQNARRVESLAREEESAAIGLAHIP